MSCKEFEKDLKGYGIEEDEINKIINFIQLVYISGGEIATSMGRPNNYPPIEDMPEIFARSGLREQIDVIKPTGGRGTGANRVYYDGLTKNGLEIASDCFAKRVEFYKEDIENIFKNYSHEFLDVFVMATYRESPNLRYVFEFRQWASEPTTIDELNREINPRHISQLTKDSKTQEELEEELDTFFSDFLLHYSKLLSEQTQKLFEELKGYHLASRTDHGDYINYIMPAKELIEFIHTRRPSEAYKKLQGLWILSLPTAVYGVSKQEYLNYLDLFGIEEEVIQMTVQTLHSSNPKAISAYNTETKNFPFLIYNQEYINREFKNSIETISADIAFPNRGGKYGQ